jgi:diguanylate cyclase (GGDEF)-like protein
MSGVLAQILQLVGVLVVVALALGVLFDRMSGGRRRDLAVGALCGTAAAATMLLSFDGGAGLRMDARAPILLVGALFGGPWGALAALPLPLVTRAALGGPAVYIGIASVLLAVGLGLAVRLAAGALGHGIGRGTVLVLAALSPLTLAALAVPHLAPEPGTFAPLALFLLLLLPGGTAVLGLVVFAELARSEGSRTQRESERFQRSTDHVSRDFFDRQMAHYARMNTRFGTHAAYLLVSVDDARAVRRILGNWRWRQLRVELAQVIRAAVRDSDVCAAIDEDRFAVLLPHTGESGMRIVAERIQRSVADGFRHSPIGAITVSIGMASFGEALEADEVAAVAETALFVANARSPRNAIGPLTPPRASAVIHSFPAPPAESNPPADDLPPPANVALFPVLIGPHEAGPDEEAARQA